MSFRAKRAYVRTPVLGRHGLALEHLLCPGSSLGSAPECEHCGDPGGAAVEAVSYCAPHIKASWRAMEGCTP